MLQTFPPFSHIIPRRSLFQEPFMLMRLSLILCLLASIAVAKPTTEPSATKLNKQNKPVPATTQAHFPTPAELIAKMKAAQKKLDAQPKVAWFDLASHVTERPAMFSLFGDNDSVTLHSLTDRIRQAAEDADVRAVLITLGEPGLSLSQAQELREALEDVHKAGKRTFVYSDSFDTDTYCIATGATDICMLAGGEFTVPGVGLDAMFLKGLLDKVGVKADYVQIGEYKGADEELTRSAPSDELRGELNKLTDGLYTQVVATIANGRKISRDDVKQTIDDAMLTGEEAKQRKLVDHLVDIDGLRDLITRTLGAQKVNIVKDYGNTERPEIDMSNPFAFLQLMTKKPEVSDKPAVALVYIDGVIVDGEARDSLFSSESNVGSDDTRRALRIAAKDDKIKALVIRINSPGGSAVASEAIWQGVRRVSKEKPVIVSVGGMAASGGYYIASSADYIFADPSSIVGSIGVVGGKIVWKDLMDKLGVGNESFHRGANSDLYSPTTPWTDHQRELVRKNMEQTYAMFTKRVMSTRTGKIKDIDKVARGRIFVAQNAKDLGMVDELGGLREAITFAADQADLTDGQYDVRVLPAPKTLADILTGNQNEALSPVRPNASFAQSALLKLLPEKLSTQLMQQVQLIQLLQSHPVLLAAPFTATVH
jgi:protease IV